MLEGRQGHQGRLAREPSAAAVALLLVALAILLRLVYGQAFVGFDTAAALQWGSDIWHGRVPEFVSSFSPTPHPLSYGLLTLAGPLGEEAQVLVQILTFLSFALLGWSAFRLGRVLFGVPVGLLFAALLLTRPLLVDETLQAFVDIPALALVLLAAALEAERPRRGVPVLILLGLAGLLRPESWLLSGAYVLWLMPGKGTRERVGLIALAAAAPLIWALTDLIVTGDPLHSLHGTQRGAELLNRPQGLEAVVNLMPVYLTEAVQEPIVWVGFAGTLLALFFFYERSLVPAAILGLGLTSFLAIGVLDLPVLRRYLLPSAVVLALFFSLAAFAWRLLPAGGRERGVAIAAGVAAFVALIVSIPGTVDGLDAARTKGREVGEAQRQLAELASTPAVQAASRRCPEIIVPDIQLGTTVSRPLQRSLLEIRVSRRPPKPRAMIFVPRKPSVREFYVRERLFRLYPKRSLARFDRVDGNELWSVWAAC